jgi:hypothetical protein
MFWEWDPAEQVWVTGRRTLHHIILEMAHFHLLGSTRASFPLSEGALTSPIMRTLSPT